MKNRFTVITLFVLLLSGFILPALIYAQIPPTISDQVASDQIVEFIEKWRQAWQNKKLDEYIACYAKNFQQNGKNLQEWRKHKQYLNRIYKTIRVDVDEIQIDLRGEIANVQFYQTYTSDKYYEEGYKLLVLTHSEENGWQILKEIFLNE